MAKMIPLIGPNEMLILVVETNGTRRIAVCELGDIIFDMDELLELLNGDEVEIIKIDADRRAHDLTDEAGEAWMHAKQPSVESDGEGGFEIVGFVPPFVSDDVKEDYLRD